MSGPARTRDGVTAVVHGAITEILPGLDPASITGGAHLRDLGADSVDRVEIILSITGRLGLDTPMSRFSDIPTIADLIDYLSEAVPQ